MRLYHEPSNRRYHTALCALPLCVGVCLAIWMLMGGAGPIGPTIEPETRTKHVSRIQGASSLPPGVGIIKIEKIRVGDRVFADNPELSDLDRNEPDPDPATWRTIDLSITKDDGDQLDITLLRPIAWIEELRAVVGGTVRLNLPEMSVHADARVIAITASPPIRSGAGRVVIGTFRHRSGDVLDVGISGVDKPIGTTAEHPFWSEDRHEFVAAGKLSIGERVRTHSGHPCEITSITRRGPPEAVYNLEVHGEHVFYVSEAGVLVHNSYPSSSNGGTDELVIDTYRNLSRRSDIVGQAHHLNQDAAFRSYIAHSEGVTLKLPGNAFSDIGTPHYVAHESMEAFWDIFRKGGMDAGNLPTNSQYNRALYNGLQESGLTSNQALLAVQAAKQQQLEAGLRGNDLVPRLPRRMGQTARDN